MKISKFEATYGDAITIQNSTNVWVDHCDLSAVRDGDKDFYDGLADLSYAADWVTISSTYFHGHVSNLVEMYVNHTNSIFQSKGSFGWPFRQECGRGRRYTPRNLCQ